jgi:hypothetical protein
MSALAFAQLSLVFYVVCLMLKLQHPALDP